MQIVIEIPTKTNEHIRADYGHGCKNLRDEDLMIVVSAIYNGTPIPDNATNGEWVDQYNDGNWHCSKCGAIVEKDEQINHNWYFCYHCGTKMNAPYQKGGKNEKENL